ncbi:multicopper oxidase family protein [Bacillus marinisedimentorum]|uniref:multicopper oxidase family protein n=1 Tax=Bacillus marinisedimentorum TaxID=1821260 RepID=UPI0007E09053|nr:multicopper oxidase domain-containing protein [Bacillus marinisedimentorum]
MWEKRLHFSDGKFATYKDIENGRYFTLDAQKIRHDVLPGVTLDGMGYNGSTPGPLIVVKQGEWVAIKVNIHLDEATSLHVHGLAKPNSQDGVPDIEPTPSIKPGESYTYRFNAWQAGTFFYHSGNPLHITRGMLGGVIVLPIDEREVPHRDYVLILQQWELPQPPKGRIEKGVFEPLKFDQNPNFFTINGKAFPETTPSETRYGERIRFRFINKSSTSHSMHLHGHDFRLIEVDGFPRSEYMDTVDVPSGRRNSIEFWSNNPGIWAVNGTKTFHQTNNGVTPGGMITRLVYKE